MNKRFEELLKEDAHFREMWAKFPHEAFRRAKAKPKPAVMAVVSEKLAEAVKANPESLRVSARASDDTLILERPRQTERLEVLEVADGKPSLVRRIDCTTGEVGMLEFVGGYRQPAGAVSDYDPIKRGLGE
jgi:hypothetical protein